MSWAFTQLSLYVQIKLVELDSNSRREVFFHYSWCTGELVSDEIHAIITSPKSSKNDGQCAAKRRSVAGERKQTGQRLFTTRTGTPQPRADAHDCEVNGWALGLLKASAWTPVSAYSQSITLNRSTSWSSVDVAAALVVKSLRQRARNRYVTLGSSSTLTDELLLLMPQPQAPVGDVT